VSRWHKISAGNDIAEHLRALNAEDRRRLLTMATRSVSCSFRRSAIAPKRPIDLSSSRPITRPPTLPLGSSGLWPFRSFSTSRSAHCIFERSAPRRGKASFIGLLASTLPVS
jgi:hypothetical protein